MKITKRFYYSSQGFINYLNENKNKSYLTYEVKFRPTLEDICQYNCYS